MARVKVHELRKKNKAELVALLKELKAELSSLPVAKVTDGAPDKLSEIEVERAAMAAELTEMCQKQRAALREAYNKKYEPLHTSFFGRPRGKGSMRSTSP